MSIDQPADSVPPTIGEVASRVLADVAPGQERYLGVTADLIFAGGATSRRAIRAALVPSRRANPTSFGAHDVQYIVGFVLAVLNGAAGNLLADQAGESLGRLRDRLRRRRQRQAIAAQVAPKALETPLPQLSAIQAAQVGGEVLRLARGAGIPEEQAQHVSTLIAAALTKTA